MIRRFYNHASWYYDRDGNPMDEDDFERELKKVVLDRDMSYTRVALSEGHGYRVSTVWVGFDYSCGEGDRQIFETIVRQDGEAIHQERYPTEEAAKAGHSRLVAKLSVIAGGMLTEQPEHQVEE